MTTVSMFSSGIGSWAATRRWVNEHGTDGLVLLFADVNGEDADNYRFLVEATEDLLGPVEWDDPPGDRYESIFGPVLSFPSREFDARLVWITNGGRTIWDVFREGRFLGNTRADPCSRELKREPMRAWLEAECDTDDTTVLLGFGWDEGHRLERARPHWEPWTIDAPMTREPYRTRTQVLDWVESHGLKAPRLYDVAGGKLPHANCGGLCVKAGQAQFEIAHRELPELYREWEDNEEEIRDLLGDVAILRDRTGGTTDPLPLAEFRKRLEAQPSMFDPDDVGSCSCMMPS